MDANPFHDARLAETFDAIGESDRGDLEPHFAIVTELNADTINLGSGTPGVFAVTNDQWSAALAAAHRALRPGGHLVFGNRNVGENALDATPRRARGRNGRRVGRAVIRGAA